MIVRETISKSLNGLMTKVNSMNKFGCLELENSWTICEVCKLKDNFVWHSHENDYELFIVFYLA